jgi:hypothetical protein
MLPTSACQRTRLERFIAGTEPNQPDDEFQRIAVDLATGGPANTDTPASRRAERVYWVLPPEYHDWMVTQGIAIAPAGLLQPAGSGQSDPAATAKAAAPLVLTSPASFTSFQIHPGLPAANQRIQVAGYVSDGRPWHALRLVMDGHAIAEAGDAMRVDGWWAMAEGHHQFWLEGQRTPESAVERSAPAQITVDPFEQGQVELTSVQ